MAFVIGDFVKILFDNANTATGVKKGDIGQIVEHPDHPGIAEVGGYFAVKFDPERVTHNITGKYGDRFAVFFGHNLALAFEDADLYEELHG